MSKLSTLFKKTDNLLISPTPLPSFPSQNNSSSSSNKISPILLLIIIILSIIFFITGIIHLIIRYLIKRPFLSRNPENNINNSSSEVLQRQLQQLFRLHDSGLDQALIDALPVFYYKDIMGIKEPFDCAVCLSEFCDQDKLRLLPLCSHAFHINCIDTWLLSNSSCPLCRGSLLVGSGLENNQEFSLEYWRELSFGRSIDCESSFRIQNNNNDNPVWSSQNNNNKPTIMEDSASERRVFSVRLGKFRSLEEGDEGSEYVNGETSSRRGGGGGGGDGGSDSSELDGRRCYSLGSYQYVLGDSNLQVALSTNVGENNGSDIKIEKMVEQGNILVDGDVEGKKISRRNRRESFSVSKIWLWSKEGKLQGSSENNVHNVNGGPPPLNVVMPLSTTDYVH